MGGHKQARAHARTQPPHSPTPGAWSLTCTAYMGASVLLTRRPGEKKERTEKSSAGDRSNCQTVVVRNCKRHSPSALGLN